MAVAPVLYCSSTYIHPYLYTPIPFYCISVAQPIFNYLSIHPTIYVINHLSTCLSMYFINTLNSLGVPSVKNIPFCGGLGCIPAPMHIMLIGRGRLCHSQLVLSCLIQLCASFFGRPIFVSHEAHRSHAVRFYCTGYGEGIDSIQGLVRCQHVDQTLDICA